MFVCLMAYATSYAAVRDTIDISGKWYFRLHNVPTNTVAEGELSLPGTLDTNHKGNIVKTSDDLSHLSRLFTFEGDASYIKKVFIPNDWQGKEIELFLERSRNTVLKIDGKKVGSVGRLSSPHRYNVTEFLTPGNHEIEVIVNNLDSIPPAVRYSSNAASENTQTNWNGILGKMLITSQNPTYITKTTLNPDFENHSLQLEVTLSQPADEDLILQIISDLTQLNQSQINKGEDSASLSISLPDESSFWNEWNPNLINLSFNLLSSDGKLLDDYFATTGFRDFNTSGTTFTINGTPTLLRGTINSAIFPLTGYSPMNKEYWREYFRKIKEYGFNHVRFHTWTPPEAAFSAADEIGIYIQTELPIWGEVDRDLKKQTDFLMDETLGIIETYSNHPSFVLFSGGNELWGDTSLMAEITRLAKDKHPTLLTTFGSNVYLGMKEAMQGEDFLVTTRTGNMKDDMLRGSFSFADDEDGGLLNSTYPTSNTDYSNALEKSGVPIVAHEVGQYQSYPDFSEVDLYTGVLKANNLQEFRNKADNAGVLNKNKQYSDASGKWAAKLYKSEIEKYLRTSGMGGFQLFGIQDYPGQGGAFVGILDPFMNEKGSISPENWRQSNNGTVILAEFPKFSFSTGEQVEIPILIANYSPLDIEGNIFWGTPFAKGEFETTPGTGLIEQGSISFKAPEITSPEKYSLKLSSANGELINSYDFWIYPKNMGKGPNIKVTDDLELALILLAKGEKVILYQNDDSPSDNTIDPLFTTDFWNYKMFKTICDEMGIKPSPGTLGLLIQNNNLLFNKFPTDSHSDWQWFPIVKNSHPLIIDRLPKGFNPIVEVIDNPERSLPLSLILECNVDKGKLLLISADLKKAAQYPEGKWLIQSAMEYMAGKDFKPELTLSPHQLRNLLTKPNPSRNGR